ncbi:MAG: DUF4405 domain-containing protein [Chloroflexota bacterium]
MKKLSINPNKLNLFLDISMALIFAALMEERFTGLRIHEVVGIGIAVAFLTHILLHWRWVVSVTRQFFNKIFHESRLNYILNLALLVDIVVVIVTGILISRTLNLNFGLGDKQFSIQLIHILSSHLSLVIVGLHVGLHWKWIVTHSQKYLFNIHLPWRKARTTQPITIESSRNSIQS